MTLFALIVGQNLRPYPITLFPLPSSKTRIPPFNITTKDPDILFLLNLTTTQRAALLTASSTLALLYTPASGHFDITPVEAMSSGPYWLTELGREHASTLGWKP